MRSSLIFGIESNDVTIWRKRLLRDVLIWALLCLLMGIVSAFFEIEASTVQIIIICLLLMALYYLVFMQPYRRRVLQQNADMVAGASEKALMDIKAMMQEPRVRKSKYFMQCCQINLSAAYCRLEQYDRTLEILKSMPEKNLKDKVQLVHHLNTCICLFYQGTEREALAYYRIHQKLFHENRRSRYYGGDLAMLKIWSLMAQGKTEEARECLEQSKKVWTKSDLKEGFEKIEKQLSIMQKRTSEDHKDFRGRSANEEI